MRIAFINRQPIEGFYSLESYFERIRAELNHLGVQTESHTSPYPSSGLLPRCRIVRFAHRHQGDITHIPGDIHFAALGTDPARTVVTVADCGRLHQLHGFKRELLRQIWFQRPLWRVAAVTVISQAVKDDLLRWVPDLPAERVHVVPVSISPHFRYSPRPFNASRPRILQVGITPNKNIPRLAEALAGLDCQLVIIGRLTPELERVLETHRIRYENHRGLSEAQVVAQYQAADLVAFASSLEGFGMPILEAQAVGRPVLTSAISPMTGVAGGAAELVDPFSVASIRHGIERLLQDGARRQRLIELGQQNVQRFSSIAIARQYKTIYESIQGASRP